MTVDSVFIVLLSVAMVVAIVARRFGFPYTVSLVVAGIALGALHVVEPPHLTRELLFTIFLPGLLFEASYALNWIAFRRHLIGILLLAVPGVIATIAITGALTEVALSTLGLTVGFSMTLAFVFGAIVAATDPVAVTALFRQMRVPVELAVLIEGESLVNDGTSIVLLALILGVVTGAPASVPRLGASFMLVAGGGVVVGVAIAWIITQAIRRIDDPMIEITLTMIAAYGSFVVGERFHVSGVIATVAAGLLCGSYTRPVAMSETTRVAVSSFWEYIAFALNSVVFLLIGFAVPLGDLARFWREIAIAYVAMTVARAGVVYLVDALSQRTTRAWPRGWSHILLWGGLRGALSMVLALSLPASVPRRDLIVAMSVGVVVLSLLLQGTTMGALLRVTRVAVAPATPP
ncbi:MAG TPA: cation:proton antiporter [Gemmatimonadaceae bacterium]|nr:cation:proton antiporter [Gemmatimonadaceae bacterium]